jgi:hypothetical protein
MDHIATINEVISGYFDRNKDKDIVPVKALMPNFIEVGVFFKDKKNGLPIRLLLRKLDEQGDLDKISAAHVVRNEMNTRHLIWK